jgi:hypothetical protein
MQFGSRGFDLGHDQRRSVLQDLIAPLRPVVRIGPEDLSRAGLDFGRLASARGQAWLGATVFLATMRDWCVQLPHGVFAVLIAGAQAQPMEMELPNGHFFGEANGFSGGGGFTSPTMRRRAWTEFHAWAASRLGTRSGRFMYGGFVTQAFQKLVLQWR